MSETPENKALQLLRELVEHGEWFHSAIELEQHGKDAIDGVEARARALAILAEACPECEGKGEVLDAPSYGDCHTYWAQCPDCLGTGRKTPKVEP